ncbi:MAG: Lar family restriction alleviation protein [Clostridia bacterium]|nr:Lar family restriction alleviation protein [Clostridia bacterium]
MNNAGLKPCPFCGANMTYIHFVTHKWLNPLRKGITCNGCGAMMTADIRETDEETEIALQDYIIEKWNRRVNDA